MTPVRLLLAVTVPLYVLDQLTKWATLEFIPLHHEIEVIPGLFNLVHVTNTGSAFGLMRGWFNFHVIFGSVMAVIILWMLFRKSTDRLTRFACALILSGIFGNITDRLIHGHVVDFLDFHLGGHHWPAFNVADSAIVIAAGLFLWSSFTAPTPRTS
ncbi:MAG: signal peptidase II [Chthoniobacterales bacterium]|nr:signal peptidase II [Chthoniobacterales bacterium]